MGSLQSRIEHLENLVISLRDTSQPKKPPKGVTSEPHIQGTSHLENAFGRIKLESDETEYVDSSHWSTILDGIAELKEHLDDHSDDELSASLQHTFDLREESLLLYGSHSRFTKEEIIAGLPPRAMADRLVATYFCSMTSTPIIIHNPTFVQEYENFWNNPNSAPIMWIGILFAIMAMGAIYQQLSAPDFVSGASTAASIAANPVAREYRERVVQCLITGKYTRCPPYTIEAFIFYSNLEYLRSEDTQADLWAIAGMGVQLALRMGYHRDPKHFPHITPFRGEMRRRVWAVLYGFDITISSQFGLPRSINEAQCDTAPPRNLMDEDFDSHCKELPPSRPDTQETATQFFSLKNRLVRMFGRVTDLQTLPRLALYSEVMQLDKELRETWEAMPLMFRTPPGGHSITADPSIIIRRMMMSVSFNKVLCLLHRKYMCIPGTDSRLAYSRKTCVEGSLEILAHQQVLHSEIQQGGRLHNNRWILTSIVKHEFLFAVTNLCLYLEKCGPTDSPSSSSQASTDEKTRERVVEALSVSYMIWLQTVTSSKESRKAAEALKVVLRKAHSEKSNSMEEKKLTDDSPPYLNGSQGYTSSAVSTNGSSDTHDTLSAPSTNGVTDFDFNVGFPEVDFRDFEMDWDKLYDTANLDEIFGTHVI